MCAVGVPVVFTIAGSDPSGAAGLQADIPTLSALGVHAASVVTLLTAQNSTGISEVHLLPPDFVRAQLEALLGDIPPAAAKTGMLRDATIVSLVREMAPQLGALVVDPVMVNSAGELIVAPEVVDAYRSLCEVATVITPNRAEAELLVGGGVRLDTVAEVEDVADRLVELGAPTVVVTGGRGHGPEAADVVVSKSRVRHLTSSRVGDRPIRGSAVAAHLAKGSDPDRAVDAAHAFVQAQLAVAPIQLGAGLPSVRHFFGDTNS